MHIAAIVASIYVAWYLMGTQLCYITGPSRRATSQERTRVACAAVGPDFQELGQELHIYRKKLNEIVKNVRAAKEQQDEYDPMTIDLSPIDDKVTKLSVALDSMIDGHTSVGKADEEEVKGFEDLFMQTQSGLRQAWELYLKGEIDKAYKHWKNK
ncbi:unnamed protein product [Symbiodinium sp. KB8]|nr:unnamed protein product [Symbiodinium sp. KB8]